MPDTPKIEKTETEIKLLSQLRELANQFQTRVAASEEIATKWRETTLGNFPDEKQISDINLGTKLLDAEKMLEMIRASAKNLPKNLESYTGRAEAIELLTEIEHLIARLQTVNDYQTAALLATASDLLQSVEEIGDLIK